MEDFFFFFFSNVLAKRSQNLDGPSASGTFVKTIWFSDAKKVGKDLSPHSRLQAFLSKGFRGQSNVGKRRPNPDKNIDTSAKAGAETELWLSKQTNTEMPGVLMKRSQRF